MTSTIRRFLVAAVLVVCVTLSAAAYGGGGIFQAEHFVLPGYTNAPGPAEVHGGYGYGASRGGRRYGGFGLVIKDQETGGFAAGFGGVMTGRQLRRGPFTVSANLYSGIGHANADLLQSSSPVAFFAEANAEAGLAILPWLQISVYGGYQAVGPMDLSTMFPGAIYAPVFGTRVTWGNF
jgi:hypothetical protein